MYTFGSNEVIAHLSTIDNMAQHVGTMIPLQVLADIDNARNPMQLTRDRLERAATENQFMNGKIVAIDVGAWLVSFLLVSLIPGFQVVQEIPGRCSCTIFPRARWSSQHRRRLDRRGR